jgi:hypothetical protein
MLTQNTPVLFPVVTPVKEFLWFIFQNITRVGMPPQRGLPFGLN